MKYETLIQKCDADIRAGRPQDVSRQLSRLNFARVPREFRLPLATICRRAGLHSHGLKLLGKLIHPLRTHKTGETPTAAEMAGFAMLLLRLGAVSEAVERLDRIDTSQIPEALLYRAWGHFLRWEYRASIPLLEQYVCTSLSPYALLVGQTNLAFAYAETRKNAAALKLCADNIQVTKNEGNHQLQSTCHALRAQVFIQQGDFVLARVELETAQGLVSLTQGTDHFLIMKWKLILDGLERKSVGPFEELRKIAIQNHEWEAWREADLYSLKVDFRRERFVHLYFGTPFADFRELFTKELGSRPDQKMYVLGPKSAPRFDLSAGAVEGSSAINPGKKCHHLIEVLLRDFYQPLRVGGLFSALFPGEYFDISSSPDRVRQLIRRTRRWFKEEKIPVSIKEVNGFYSLNIDGAFSFRIPLQRPSIELFSHSLEKVKSIFGEGQTFLAKDVQEKLDLPKSTVRQLIKSGMEKGLIVRQGDTSRTATYMITLSALHKKAA